MPRDERDIQPGHGCQENPATAPPPAADVNANLNAVSPALINLVVIAIAIAIASLWDPLVPPPSEKQLEGHCTTVVARPDRRNTQILAIGVGNDCNPEAGRTHIALYLHDKLEQLDEAECAIHCMAHNNKGEWTAFITTGSYGEVRQSNICGSSDEPTCGYRRR